MREIRKTYLDLVRKTEKLSFGPDERIVLQQQGGYSDSSRYGWKLGRLFLTTRRLVFCEPSGGSVFQTPLNRVRGVGIERKRTGLGTKPTLCVKHADMKSETLIKVWFLLKDVESWRRKISSMTLIEISEEEINRIVEELDPAGEKILEYLRLQGHARIDELAELIEAPTHMEVLLKIKRNINPTAERIAGNPVLEFVNSKTDELTGENVMFSWWFCGYLMNKEKRKEPLLDVFDEKNDFTVIMETSGVEKDDVVFPVEKNKLILFSNLVDDKYKAEISLPPKVNRENFTKRYNNNILELKFRKMKGSEKRWESSVAFHLEQLSIVESYARNDHLDFTIDYEFNGSQHPYIPDFLVKLTNGLNVILEVKGYEDEQSRAKHEAAKRWCKAVSRWGEMGEWKFVICRNPRKIRTQLGQLTPLIGQ